MTYPNRSDFTAPVQDAGWWLARRSIGGRPVDTLCAAAGATFAREVQRVLRAATPDLDSGRTPWKYPEGWVLDPRQFALDGAWGQATLAALLAYLGHHGAPAAMRTQVRAAYDARRIDVPTLHAAIWVFEHAARDAAAGVAVPELYVPADSIPPAYNRSPPPPPGWRADTAFVACGALMPCEPRPEAWAADDPCVITETPAPPAPAPAPLPAPAPAPGTPSDPFSGSWNPLDYEDIPVSDGNGSQPRPPAPVPSADVVAGLFGAPAPSTAAASTAPAPSAAAPQPTVVVLERAPVVAPRSTTAPATLAEGYTSKPTGEATTPTPTILGVKWWIPVAVGGAALLLVGGVVAYVATRPAAPRAGSAPTRTPRTNPRKRRRKTARRRAR
jgi:hypothetical protein